MQACISKEFEFSASHQLAGLPDSHPCSRLHGHNYRVKVSITGTVVPPGFVVDYRELDFFKEWLNSSFDHRHLNDCMQDNPTAENIAQLMATTLRRHLLERGHRNISQISLGVSETPKTWATVTLDVSAGDAGQQDGR